MSTVTADYFDVTDADRQRAAHALRYQLTAEDTERVARQLADARISGYAHGATDATDRLVAAMHTLADELEADDISWSLAAHRIRETIAATLTPTAAERA